MSWQESLWIMCWTQRTMEESVNTSTMGNGGNSPTMRSVKACNTETMRRTTGNPTTTIPTALWYCKIAFYCGVLLHVQRLHRDVFCRNFLTCFRLKPHLKARRSTMTMLSTSWKREKRRHLPMLGYLSGSLTWKWEWAEVGRESFCRT